MWRKTEITDSTPNIENLSFMSVKVSFRAIMLVVGLFSAFNLSANQYVFRYRVQCAISSDNNSTELLSKIPDQSRYILNTGTIIYFSGEYFNHYDEAKIRLDSVQALGFKDAHIRLFKSSVLLTKTVGDKYIEKLEKYRLLEVERQKKLSAQRESIAKANQASSLKGKRYTKAELAAKKLKEKEFSKKKNSEDLSSNNVDETASDSTAKEIEEVKNGSQLMVDEPPVFKIQLAVTHPGELAPQVVNDLTSQVVYTYTEGAKKVYAVGAFETSKEARKYLMNYQRYSVGSPFVIGIYKGRVVSEQMAIELYNAYLNFKSSSN